MSPRAALRLEAHGFGPVYDYAAGKADWLAAGLPSIRSEGVEARVIDEAEPPVTGEPDTPVADLPEGHVIVIDHNRIVLGEITTDTERPDGAAAADVMREGPATVRADEPLDALTERMRAKNVDSVLVTTPEGRLLGVYHPPRGPDSGEDPER